MKYDINTKTKETAILLATYNGEKYISEQLDSLVKQTYKDFVCYIHDDESNDGTKGIVDEYCRQYPELFVRLDYCGCGGAAGNFLSLIRFAAKNTCEKYILFCDHDDVWLPNKVEIQINEIKKFDSQNIPALIYCDQIIVDKNLEVIADSGMKYSQRTKKDDFKHLVFENSAAGCVICINRNLLKLAEKYSDIDNIVMHDWWLMLIATINDSVYYIHDSLMLYRQHSNNTLGAERKDVCFKMKKYSRKFIKSIKSKYRHVRKCERQVIELKKIIDRNNPYYLEVNRFCEMLENGKVQRMIYLYKNGYIAKSEWFTLLFV